MLVSRFCAKVSDDFAFDDIDVNIQEGNGCERVIARELYRGVDIPLRSVVKASRCCNGVCPCHENVICVTPPYVRFVKGKC